MRQRRGFLLLVVLGFSAALVLLFVSLTHQGQSLGGLLQHQGTEVDRHIAMMDTNARIGIALSSDPSSPPPAHILGNVDLGQSFTTEPFGDFQIAPRIHWGKSANSVRYPIAANATGYDNLFSSGANLDDDSQPPHDYLAGGDEAAALPRVGYQDELIQKNLEGYPIAPGHTLISMEGLHHHRTLSMFDQSFPFAAYAPAGSVSLDEVVSWSNPTFDESEDKLSPVPDPLQFATGLPANVRARGSLTIHKNFPAGKALSEQGPVSVRGGGLALTGPLGPDLYCSKLAQQSQDAIARISDGALNKSKFIAGKFLDVQGILSLFKGKIDAATRLLSVQQATQFPFPPFPTLQEDLLVTVLMIHHPWPPDFSGTISDTTDLEALESIHKEVKALKDQVAAQNARISELEKQISSLRSQLADPKLTQEQKDDLSSKIKDLQSKVDDARGQVKDLNRQIDDLNKQAKEKQDAIDKKSKEVWNGLPGKIPQNAWEDLKVSSDNNWCYVLIGEALMKALFRSIGGDLGQLLNTLVPPVRLVHLGSLNPDWLFDSDATWPYPGQQGYRIKATVNVPAGKTLKLSGKFDSSGQRVEIQGDLWIQRGATCFVDGNLEIMTPPNWGDIAGTANAPLLPDKSNKDDYQPVEVPQYKADGSTNLSFPWGRVILEEGATLVVSGDLNVSGGNRETGSVLCCSSMGSTRVINSAILCQGNVRIAHGIYSGVTLEALLGRLGRKENPRLKGLVDDYLGPFMSGVFPNLGKVWGPWNFRPKCYFATNATTFVFLNFLAELGLAEIPFPFPMRQKNLERKIYLWLSQAFSVELNFYLGENLTTQANWWLLGRGVAPVLPKVPASLVKNAVPEIPYKKLDQNAWFGFLGSYVKDTIPEMIKLVIKEVVIKCVNAILKQAIPFKFVQVPDDGAFEQAQDLLKQQLLDEIAKVVSPQTKSGMMATMGYLHAQIQRKFKEQNALGNDLDYMCREVPGVYVYSGKELVIGQGDNPESALTALGFFFAEGNLRVSAERIVGALVSRRGDINCNGLLYYYPYFTRASLYNAPKPRNYSVLPTDDLRNAFQFKVPKPASESAIDLSVPCARITASGVLK